MLTYMSGNRSAINVKAATGAETHHNTQRFSLIERLLRIAGGRDQEQKTNNQHRREKLHSLPLES
jgi:hypothetical protein